MHDLLLGVEQEFCMRIYIQILGKGCKPKMEDFNVEGCHRHTYCVMGKRNEKY